jgi:hypothetical protein
MNKTQIQAALPEYVYARFRKYSESTKISVASMVKTALLEKYPHLYTNDTANDKSD